LQLEYYFIKFSTLEIRFSGKEVTLKIEELSDEKLIVLYKEKDEEAFNILLRRYRIYAKKIANNYRSYPWVQYIGMDDLLAVADVCFFVCINAFKDDRGCSFKTYFTRCLNRKFSGMRSKVYNQKNKAMYEAILVGNYSYQDQEIINDIENIVTEVNYDFLPDRNLMIKETLETIGEVLDKEASTLEKKIYELIFQGFSVEEVAEMLDIDKRSVSNAKYRIKNKIKNYDS